MNKQNKPAEGQDSATGRPAAVLRSGHSYDLLIISRMHLIFTIIHILTFIMVWDPDEYSDDTSSIDFAVEVVFDVVPIVLAIVVLLFDICLIRGAGLAATRPVAARRWVLAWLVCRAMLYGVIVLGFITLGVAYYIDLDNRRLLVRVSECLFYIAAAIMVGLYWYGWSEVLKHYRRLGAAAAGDVTYSRMKEEGETEEVADPGMV